MKYLLPWIEVSVVLASVLTSHLEFGVGWFCARTVQMLFSEGDEHA